MNIRDLLEERISKAISTLAGSPAKAMLARSSRPEFGDYQANGVMSVAKKLKRNPRDLAQELVQSIQLDGIAEKLEVAGPGFINIWLSKNFLSDSLCNQEQLLTNTAHTETVVIDYSSPNLAKEMHVGHLRTTIIGDSIARVLTQLGHKVIRQNHVGDWGTQFGMLLTYMQDQTDNLDEYDNKLADLENFYRAAKARFDSEPEFARRARTRVVALQAGDEETLKAWKQFINTSLSHCQTIYQQLDVQLSPDDVMGESAYNDDLQNIIADLQQKQLLVESHGAKCVFLEEFTNKQGEPLPVIVQKSDGGFLYATTDLAAIRYRFSKLHADRALYIVGAPQILHFQQIFALAKKANFIPEGCEITHHPFGSILGKDGRPFSTRKGGVEKLGNLLDEAEQRAYTLVAAKNPELGDEDLRLIAKTVGIGAIKYADLSKNRTGDYIFDWDQMLSFEGNTAPYLLYAYSRIQSLFRRGNINFDEIKAEVITTTTYEHQLAVNLLGFQEVVELVARDALPHQLCNYLFDLASCYMRFYEHCPVLSAEKTLSHSRLILCKKTAETLKAGLYLLGISTVERM